MATNLFNYTNQKLSADELRQINSFNSYNYAGIVGSKSVSPFEYSGNFVTLKATEFNPIVFLGGGLLLNQTSDLLINMTTNKSLAYLEINLDNNKGNILTDESEGVTLKYAQCSDIVFKKSYTTFALVTQADGNPSESGYYEYISDTNTYVLSSNASVIPEKSYYIKFESSNFTFKSDTFGNKTFTYFGNTIWITDRIFIIPLIIRLNDKFEEVVGIQDLRDLEGFLSLEAYSKLKAYCEGTFVWTVGGEEEVIAPDGTKHKKGDIGELNITGNVIKNLRNRGTDQNPVYSDPVEITNLNIQSLQGGTDKDRLVVDENGNLQLVKNYKVPVVDGGTYLESNWDENNPWKSAKTNLHIRYGTGDPSSVYTTPVEGDIYLKIVE